MAGGGRGTAGDGEPGGAAVPARPRTLPHRGPGVQTQTRLRNARGPRACSHTRAREPPLPRGSAATPVQTRSPFRSADRGLDRLCPPHPSGPRTPAPRAPLARRLRWAQPSASERASAQRKEALDGRAAAHTHSPPGGRPQALEGHKRTPLRSAPGSPPPRGPSPRGSRGGQAGSHARRPRPASCRRTRAAGPHKARRSRWLRRASPPAPGPRGQSARGDANEAL